MFINVFKTRGTATALAAIKLHVNINSRSVSTDGTEFLAQQHVNVMGTTSATRQTRYREASTLNACVFSQTASMVSEEEKDEFLAVFPQVVNDLTENLAADLGKAITRYTDILEYNLPYGRLTPGLAFIAMSKMLQPSENLTPEAVRLINILGWCVEMSKTSWIVIDDTVDASSTRKGRTCWYKKEDVGLRAINDATLLANALHLVLKKYVSGRRCYEPSMQHFHNVNMKLAMGETLDNMLFADGKPQLHLFTVDRYNALRLHKAGYMWLYCPAIFALYFADKYDEKMHSQAGDIFLKLGSFLQIQNDIVDCFGDPGITGKVGTDIQEGKCTWLITTALQRATPSQRQILENNYGRQEPECSVAVRSLYEEMHLLDVYLDFWHKSFHRFRAYIQQRSTILPPELFFHFLNVIYGKAE